MRYNEICEGRVEYVTTYDGLDTKVLVNPTVEMVKNAAVTVLRRRGRLYFRGLVHMGKDLYLWDGWESTHTDIAEGLFSDEGLYHDLTHFDVENTILEPTKLGDYDVWNSPYAEDVVEGCRQAIEYKNSLP